MYNINKYMYINSVQFITLPIKSKRFLWKLHADKVVPMLTLLWIIHSQEVGGWPLGQREGTMASDLHPRGLLQHFSY